MACKSNFCGGGFVPLVVMVCLVGYARGQDMEDVPRGGMTPDALLRHIDEGANADHLKYRFLMTLAPRGTDRNAIVAQVHQALEQEKDPGRRLLLDSVLAFGLTRGKNEQGRQAGVAMYLSLLQDKTWPAEMQKQRERTRADFLRATDALKNAEGAYELVAKMFKVYLCDDGTPGDGAAFASLMDAGTVQNEAMRKVIEELSPGLEKNAGFWTRLGEFHMVRRRYDDSAACFAKAWEIGPKDDAEIKRVGHGLVASHERQYKYSQAIEAEKAVLDRLAVKDDYLRLAEIHRRAKNIEAMKAAIANQLEAAPTLQGKVEAARVYVDAKLPEDGMAVLNGVPRTIGADQNPTVRAAVLAATVLRIRSAKDQGTAPDAELVGILRSNRAEFLDLARDLVWLQPYYRQGEGYLRTPRQQVDQPPRQEQKP